MAGYIIGAALNLAVYAIVINKVDSGRCFRYEYIIKTLVIFGIEIICFVVVAVNTWPLIKIISAAVFIGAVFFSLKFTIQRFYDLNLSGWYILLKALPVVSIIVTLYLYFKKSDGGVNDYDKAVDYNRVVQKLQFLNNFH